MPVKITHTTGHHPKDSAGPLELGQCRPVGIETFEDFRVDGIACFHLVEISLFPAPLWIAPSAAGVHPAERFAGPVSLRWVQDLAEEPSADDFEGLVDCQRFPDRLYSGEESPQCFEGPHPSFSTCLLLAFWKCNHQHGVLAGAD